MGQPICKLCVARGEAEVPSIVCGAENQKRFGQSNLWSESKSHKNLQQPRVCKNQSIEKKINPGREVFWNFSMGKLTVTSCVLQILKIRRWNRDLWCPHAPTDNKYDHQPQTFSQARHLPSENIPFGDLPRGIFNVQNLGHQPKQGSKRPNLPQFLWRVNIFQLFSVAEN